MIKSGITIRDIVDTVRVLAAEAPCNHYHKPPVSRAGTCFNNKGKCDNGSVGCIIGQAVSRLGFEDFEDEDNRSAYELVAAVLGLPEHLVSENHYKENEWLGAVQEAQDDEREWAEAIKIADKEIKDAYPDE